MQIVGLDHIQLAMPPGGETEARRFYGEILGLTEAPKPASLVSRGGCWFEGHGAVVHLGVEENFVPARKAHPGFRVADLAEAHRTLEAAGVPVIPDDTLPDVCRFYTVDPFGNRIEFIQAGDSFKGIDSWGECVMSSTHKSLIRKVDCVRMYVPDLDAGLSFYRDQLGHDLIWRTEQAVGLRLPETEIELVLQTEEQRQEIDFTVASADAAAKRIEEAGGKIIVPPFDILIGRCVVIEDPWGNPLVLLDASKGLLVTDDEGNVIGNAS